MPVPKGFQPFYRNAHASAMGVTINQRTGHLMFNSLAKRSLLSTLAEAKTTELTFYFEDETNRLFMAPAQPDERGWKLNVTNGMVSAAKVRDWMLDHDYEPAVGYSLIPSGKGWLIEPETLLTEREEPVVVRRHRRQRPTLRVQDHEREPQVSTDDIREHLFDQHAA